MCVGACGPMSSNANTSSSSYTIFDGIFFAAILQNRQSALILASGGGTFIEGTNHRRKTVPVAELISEMVRDVYAGHIAETHAVEQVERRVILLNENGRVRNIQPLAKPFGIAAIANRAD